MIKGANYKANANKAVQEYNQWGWDYATILDVRISRVIHWLPSEETNTDYMDLPNGDIKTIVDNQYQIIMYFYNSEEKPNTALRDIAIVTEEEFYEAFQMTYDLVSIDGVFGEQADG